MRKRISKKICILLTIAIVSSFALTPYVSKNTYATDVYIPTVSQQLAIYLFALVGFSTLPMINIINMVDQLEKNAVYNDLLTDVTEETLEDDTVKYSLPVSTQVSQILDTYMQDDAYTDQIDYTVMGYPNGLTKSIPVVLSNVALFESVDMSEYRKYRNRFIADGGEFYRFDIPSGQTGDREYISSSVVGRSEQAGYFRAYYSSIETVFHFGLGGGTQRENSLTRIQFDHQLLSYEVVIFNTFISSEQKVVPHFLINFDNQKFGVYRVDPSSSEYAYYMANDTTDTNILTYDDTITIGVPSSLNSLEDLIGNKTLSFSLSTGYDLNQGISGDSVYINDETFPTDGTGDDTGTGDTVNNIDVTVDMTETNTVLGNILNALTNAFDTIISPIQTGVQSLVDTITAFPTVFEAMLVYFGAIDASLDNLNGLQSQENSTQDAIESGVTDLNNNQAQTNTFLGNILNTLTNAIDVLISPIQTAVQTTAETIASFPSQLTMLIGFSNAIDTSLDDINDLEAQQTEKQGVIVGGLNDLINGQADTNTKIDDLTNAIEADAAAEAEFQQKYDDENGRQDYGDFKNFFDIFLIFFYLIVVAIKIMYAFYQVVLGLLTVSASTVGMNADIISGIDFVKNLEVLGINFMTLINALVVFLYALSISVLLRNTYGFGRQTIMINTSADQNIDRQLKAENDYNRQIRHDLFKRR